MEPAVTLSRATSEGDFLCYWVDYSLNAAATAEMTPVEDSAMEAVTQVSWYEESVQTSEIGKDNYWMEPAPATSPDTFLSTMSSLCVPENLDDFLDLVLPCPLPVLTAEDVDAMFCPQDVCHTTKESLDLRSGCSSPESGYSSGLCSEGSPDSGHGDSSDFQLPSPYQADFSTSSSTSQEVQKAAPAVQHHQDQWYSASYQKPKESYQKPKESYQKPKESYQKPKESYVAMVAKAIMSSPEGCLLLADIYKYIVNNYPFYQVAKHSWKNSVRHNLSTNPSFVKLSKARSGKGFYWGIHPVYLESYKSGLFHKKQLTHRLVPVTADTHQPTYTVVPATKSTSQHQQFLVMTNKRA